MLRSPLVKIALPLVALSMLAACTTTFDARVSRFQALPAPSGQSFAIEAADKSKAGSLEFATYAALVSQRLQAAGFAPAENPAAATLIVKFDYGVGDGREKVETRPGPAFGGFYGGWHRGYYRPYWGGYYDPFWGGPGWNNEVYSYTLYPSHVSMRINRASDSQSLFEGRAESAARSNDLTRLVPNLVDAMFTNFPGRSGEVVKVSIPQAPKRS
ncbi:DUF4136 domain-containing protein [Sandaracinobacteroides saxicola]|uniref:DUF4136 domain-containing protein n=1 Tax=Sandaracinobacteroides saxicola TaxID=2759707 RepID=A0A7G5IM04_9SPHN|nr:DUF4136 domain-containing protein [Sandaracinobacteroides saxicola]QMW24396.1 DUF4136 domain-containing protein [Sandaracinobacteroides saxicola]